MFSLRYAISLAAAGAMTIGAGSVSAQNYPSKPIRIFTSPPGGGPDYEARLIAPGISGPLGQPVIIENRPIFIAAETAVKAPADGYNLLLIANPFFVGPLLQDMRYDPVNDFSPITLVSREPNLLVVHPSLPVKSVKELIVLAKARPGALNYGSGSSGSSLHLAAELFKFMTGVNIVRIAYKGGGQAVIDLLGGHVQIVFATTPSVAPQVKSGKLRALGVTGSRPSALLPDLPTVAASGLPGFEFVGLDGVYVPAKTPADIINRLHQEIVRYLRTAEAKEKFLAGGIEIVVSSPEELTAAMKADMAKISKLIKSAGIKSD